MLLGLVKPSIPERDSGGNSHQHNSPSHCEQDVAQLPGKIAPARAQPAAPLPSNVTFLRQDAVEKNEAHDAADVHQNDAHRARGHHRRHDHASKQKVIDAQRSQGRQVRPASGMHRGLKVRAAESVGAQLARQQSDKGKLRPLADAKRPKQLLPGMFQGGRDRINGAESHGHLKAARDFSSTVLSYGTQAQPVLIHDSSPAGRPEGTRTCRGVPPLSPRFCEARVGFLTFCPAYWAAGALEESSRAVPCFRPSD